MIHVNKIKTQNCVQSPSSVAVENSDNPKGLTIMLKVMDIMVYRLQTLPQCYPFLSQAFVVFYHRCTLTPPRKKVNVGMILLNFEHSYQGSPLEELRGPSGLTLDLR